MDWSNERYVRIYTRDSRNLKLFGWEGRALLWEVIRKADRAGVLEGVRDADDVALMVDMPVEVVRTALARIQSVDPETIQMCGLGAVLPSYILAQESKQSDKQRQRESRARRAAKALQVTPCDLVGSRPVTRKADSVTAGHNESQPVTVCHSVPSCAVPSLDPPVVPHGDARKVFDHWAKTMGHERAKLDDKRRRRIEARLKDFTVEQLCQAISGAKRDPFLMGEDPRAGRRYDGIETLLRDTGQVERLLELETKGQRSKPRPPKPSSAGFVFDEKTQTWRRTRKPSQRPVDELSVGDDPWGLGGTTRAQEPAVAPRGGIQGLLSNVGSPMDPPSVRKGKTVEEIDEALAKESK